MKIPQLIIVTLFLSLSVAEDASPQLVCKKPKSSICTLQNVMYLDYRLPNLPNLENKRTVQIRSGNIPRFSQEFARTFANVPTVQLGHLKIESLWLGSKVRHLHAEGNLISSLIVEEKSKATSDEVQYDEIEEDLVFQMETLNLANNKLRNVRELQNFTSLLELNLDGNEMEFLEMELFTKMVKLKKLSLAGNKINQINTLESIDLPSLAWLSFASNNLTSLGVSKWRMTQLTELHLSYNRLVSLDKENFDQFVSLEKLAMAGNSWNCYWLGEALKLIDKKFISLINHDSECQNMLVEGICCTMTETTDNYPSFADLTERISTFESSQKLEFSELHNRLHVVNENWLADWAVLDEKVSKYETYRKKLSDPNDDSRVTEKDISELTSALAELESQTNELQRLSEEDSKFVQHFTRLLYVVWEQRNKLISHAKNISELKEEMERYKGSFNANFL